MHFNVPLPPYRVVVGHGAAVARRRLPRPRLRFTVRGLVILAPISGWLLSIAAQAVRDEARASFHWEELEKVAKPRVKPVPDHHAEGRVPLGHGGSVSGGR
jgi:hypothetical protein